MIDANLFAYILSSKKSFKLRPPFFDTFEVLTIPTVSQISTTAHSHVVVGGDNRDLAITTKHVSNEGKKSVKWTSHTETDFVDESPSEEPSEPESESDETPDDKEISIPHEDSFLRCY